MSAEQSMTETIMQSEIKATKAAIMAVTGVDKPVNITRPVHTALRSGSPALKQPKFDWKAAEKYQELCNFEIEVKAFS